MGFHRHSDGDWSRPLIVQDDERVGRWVVEKAGGRWSEGNQAIGIERNGKLVVGVMYDGFTGSNISMHFRCDDPAATTRFFYRIAFDYPFNVCHVKRITGLVNTNNLKAQAINEKLGFTREAVLENYFPDGDAIIYRMYRHDCRWLRK